MSFFDCLESLDETIESLEQRLKDYQLSIDNLERDLSLSKTENNPSNPVDQVQLIVDQILKERDDSEKARANLQIGIFTLIIEKE